MAAAVASAPTFSQALHSIAMGHGLPGKADDLPAHPRFGAVIDHVVSLGNREKQATQRGRILCDPLLVRQGLARKLVCERAINNEA